MLLNLEGLIDYNKINGTKLCIKFTRVVRKFNAMFDWL
jgi:hypothetical protein